MINMFIQCSAINDAFSMITIIERINISHEGDAGNGAARSTLPGRLRIIYEYYTYIYI